MNGAREALLPLPVAAMPTSEKVQLGESLFFEKRLSRDNSVSCASCHDFARGGADRLPVSIGIEGKAGLINTPTVFNAAFNFAQFWDGRATTLEEQAAGPVHNPVEMGSNWAEVVPKLQEDASYRARFGKLYPGRGISGATIVDAIAAFERTLITPNSRFDRYLRGDETALTELERTGYRRFIDYGCASCHQGINIGGNLYQRFGVMRDYFAHREPTQVDLGRFNVTGRGEDRHVFKVPSLRNVAATPPYFHDASAHLLEEAVTVMGRYQLGRELSTNDVLSITAFLRTLTGEWQGRPLE
jgi:cytochrome c peroxidase